MSQNAYHWEALRKQRVIDRRTEALKRREEYEAHQEAVRTNAAAREEAERQKREVSRQKVLKDQVDHRNWSAVKKSTNDRNREMDRLLREQSWHNGLITKMEQEDKDHLLAELLHDHQYKAKILRDHGLYRGNQIFFTDPQYQ